MAASDCATEMFSCSVCLDVLCDPATLPCGHTYCLQCIQKHWDKAKKGGYSCPQCRQAFNPRPSLGRNNMLMEAMKKLSVRDQESSPSPVGSSLPSSAAASTEPPRGEQVRGTGEGEPKFQEGLYPQLPSSSPKLCPLHHQVLGLYCCDDKESVCDECSLLGHKGHRVVCPDEEKNEKQQELAQMKANVQKCVHDREKIIQTLPQILQAHKKSLQGLQKDNLEVFSEAMRSVELVSSHVTGLLQNYEFSCYNRIEGHRYRLQQEICQLYKQEEELNSLVSTEDSIEFLNRMQALDSMATVGQVSDAEMQISQPEAEASGISSALGAFRVGLHDFIKEGLANIFRAVNDVTVPTPVSPAETSGPVPPAQTSGPVPPAQTSGPVPPAQTSGPVPPAQTSEPVPPPQASGPVPPTQTSAAVPVPGDVPPTSQTSASAKSDDDKSKPTVRTGLVSSTPPQHPPPASASLVKKSVSCNGENPAPQTREEMVKFRFEPTLDHNTTYQRIRLSDGDRKATLRAESQNYPEHAERFLYWRQVMCLEPLAGSPYYWEVEWTGPKVTIGVAYKDMPRSTSDDSSRIGHNEHSWGLYWSGSAFSLWHAGRETVLAAPKARCVGIFLDQQAGVLAFYRVSHNQAHQICCIETEFSGPLYPSFRFWSGVGSTITLCQMG